MKYLFLFCLVATCWRVNAQHENDNWYFGEYAAIGFQTGSAVNLQNGVSIAQEGCSTISDTSGNLLFYTNGISVRNVNHEVMPNGFGLYGGYSSTQAALIARDPANNMLYYIFTTDDFAGWNGLCYSIVDMSLDGGLGDVTYKNIQLLPSTDEKLTGTLNAGGDGFWILTRKYPNSYYAFPLSTSGIGVPVVSTLGPTPSGSYEAGYLKISPNGNKVVSCFSSSNQYVLADFDKVTGVMSNAFSLGPTSIFSHAAEFSPNSSILYLGTLTTLYQLNLNAGDSTAIWASAQIIYVGTESYALQLGPDKKIYRAQYQESYLGVINNPDSLGAACNYIDQGFNLNTDAFSRTGLPNCITSQTVLSNNVNSFFTVSEVNVCEGECSEFNNQSSNANTYQWQFPGGTPNTSTETNPTVCYSTAGSYDVTLISSNSAGSDTLTVVNYIMVTFPNPPTITQINDTLHSSPESGYQWYQDSVLISGATNQYYIPTLNGTYSVEIVDSLGCTATNLFEFYLQPTATIQPSVTKICPDSCISFGNQSTNATSYEWFFQGGNPNYSTDEFPNVCYNTSGLYDVTLIAHNGPYSDTTTSSNLIQVYATPSPTITQSNDTLYATNVQTGSAYQWLLNGSPISGSTNSFVIPTISGTYSVNVTSPQSCSGSDTLVVTIIGIDEITESTFQLYPNPADESVTVSLSNHQPAEIKLYNTLGQVIKNATFDKLSAGLVVKSKTIDLSDVPAGIYYLSVQTENNLLTKRLIVTHTSR